MTRKVHYDALWLGQNAYIGHSECTIYKIIKLDKAFESLHEKCENHLQHCASKNDSKKSMSLIILFF